MFDRPLQFAFRPHATSSTIRWFDYFPFPALQVSFPSRTLHVSWNDGCSPPSGNESDRTRLALGGPTHSIHDVLPLPPHSTIFGVLHLSFPRAMMLGSAVVHPSLFLSTQRVSISPYISASPWKEFFGATIRGYLCLLKVAGLEP